jgi:hypothetical protein
LAARFVDRLSPGLLPDLGMGKDFEGYYRDKLFREFCLERVKAKKKSLSWKQVKTSFADKAFYDAQKRFVNYFIIKIKYLLIRAAMRVPGVVSLGVRAGMRKAERKSI